MKKINWRYAIGEIIIVMIGITLAFGLNNFRDHLHDHQLKEQYLENMKSDIEEEIQHLKEIETDINERITSIRVLRPHFGIEKEGRDTVINELFKVAEIVVFKPKNTTYQTLINSGDMKLIDNFQLRRMVEAHYSSHQEVLQNYERLKHIYTDYLGDFFIKKMDFWKIRNGDLSIMDDPFLAKIYNSLEGSYHLAIRTNKECMESNQKLLQAIKVEQKN